jgi:hypothetical protein
MWTWNTKQVFLYVFVEYQTKKNVSWMCFLECGVNVFFFCVCFNFDFKHQVFCLFCFFFVKIMKGVNLTIYFIR